jgi:hypothetical protein
MLFSLLVTTLVFDIAAEPQYLYWVKSELKCSVLGRVLKLPVLKPGLLNMLFCIYLQLGMRKIVGRFKYQFQTLVMQTLGRISLSFQALNIISILLHFSLCVLAIVANDVS